MGRRRDGGGGPAVLGRPQAWRSPGSSWLLERREEEMAACCGPLLPEGFSAFSESPASELGFSVVGATCEAPRLAGVNTDLASIVLPDYE